MHVYNKVKMSSCIKEKAPFPQIIIYEKMQYPQIIIYENLSKPKNKKSLNAPRNLLRIYQTFRTFMVAQPRFELGTHGFSVRCSTY